MKQLLHVFLGILAICLLGLAVSRCPSTDRVSTSEIPETNLKVITRESTYYEQDDATIFYISYLISSNDTIAHCQGAQPFINARGIVCIPHDGVYDCRNKAREKILSLDEETRCIDISQLENENNILIRIRFPDKNKMFGSKTKDYTYNLQSKALTE